MKVGGALDHQGTQQKPTNHMTTGVHPAPFRKTFSNALAFHGHRTNTRKCT